MNHLSLVEAKSKTNKHFKAGDFTSGKMGEIFKSCHNSLDLVCIDHKQFGSANLIPVEYIAHIVCRSVRRNNKFKEFMLLEYLGIDFIELNYDDAFDIVNDFLCKGFDSWFDMMTGLVLAWGNDDDQDLQNTKTDL